MNQSTLVAVTSRAFSKNPLLRNELLAKYPHAKFNETGEKLEDNKLIAFLNNCEKVIAGIEKFDEKIFSALPKLKVLSRFGVGLDQIDLTAMQQYGIKLGWFPQTNSLAVAELTLGFMLALLRNSFVLSNELKQGKWHKTPGWQLSGKTIGIIGFGNIGKTLVKLLRPFECRILVNDIVPTTYAGVKQVDFQTLISSANIITLHLPASLQNYHLINENVFAKMQADTFFINTSRGSIVDQTALKNALINKQIAGAALDVYEKEPPDDEELLMLPNLICTPHIAGNSCEAELAMGRAAIIGLD